jgi:hypothetical protein
MTTSIHSLWLASWALYAGNNSVCRVERLRIMFHHDTGMFELEVFQRGGWRFRFRANNPSTVINQYQMGMLNSYTLVDWLQIPDPAKVSHPQRLLLALTHFNLSQPCFMGMGGREGLTSGALIIQDGNAPQFPDALKSLSEFNRYLVNLLRRTLHTEAFAAFSLED